MPRKFYAVMVRWVATPMTAENIKKIDDALGTVGDWLRFSGSNWVLTSDKSSEDIFRALAQILHKDDSEIIVQFDPATVSGWAPKWVNDWIMERRDI